MTDPVSPCRLDMLMRLLLARLVGRVGMNRSAIARALDLHRHTVQKYYPLTVAPERHHTTRKTSALTPYEGYLLERWRDGCQNAKQLWREVVARGDPGAYRGVALLARHLRDRERAGQLLPRALTGLTPAGATGIAMMRPEKRTAYERHVLVQVGDQHTEVQTTLALFASFAALLRERGEGEPSAQLDQGMAEAGSSGIAESRGFATKLRQDRAAVLAALTLPHSQGQTEGQVNTLKLVKRAMYDTVGEIAGALNERRKWSRRMPNLACILRRF